MDKQSTNVSKLNNISPSDILEAYEHHGGVHKPPKHRKAKYYLNTTSIDC